MNKKSDEATFFGVRRATAQAELWRRIRNRVVPHTYYAAVTGGVSDA